MNSVQQRNPVPAACRQCGFMFPSPIDLGNSRHVAVVGLDTTCPKCGGRAQILDSYTDSEGRIHVKDLFEYIQNFQNHKKLEELKTNLEAANDDITAVELADTLAEIEPGFSKFADLIRYLPGSAVFNLVTILISLITLVVTYQTRIEGTEAHEERMEVERSQLEVARENLDYQKKKDLENEDKATQADLDKDSLQAQIEQLQIDFETKLAEALRQQSSQVPKSTAKHTQRLKGNQRNKPCPCGSGRKAKKCHPNGLR